MIITESVEFAAEGGRVFNGHIARPEQPRGPVVLILSEMFGLNDAMRRLAAEYAERGYAAVVPNVYWRCEHPGALAYEGDERQLAWDRLAAFDFDKIGADMKLAADWSRRQPWSPSKVMAIGFCAGGKMAYLAASRSGVDGAVSFYGLGIAGYVDEASRIQCPVQLHYGLIDQHIPLSEIEAVENGVAGNPRIEVIKYPDAGHSFCNPVRPGFHAPSAQAAAKRVDELLASLA